MQRYQNVAQDALGNIIQGMAVSVFLHGTQTPATIFSDNGVTTIPNPTSTDALGTFAFYAADGRYDLQFAKTGLPTTQLLDILLFDAGAAVTVPNIVESIAALKALPVPTVPATYLVRGYFAAGDGGGGFFWWNAADVSADNGGTIIAPNAGGTGRWERQLNGASPFITHFGATTGASDNTTAIQNAINAVGDGGAIGVPVGRFKFTNLTVPTGTTIFGQGYFNSVQGTFGDPGYLLANRTFGSILQSTATTGAAITLSNQTFIKDHQLKDIFIIGPGSGTSIGLQVGAVGGLGCIQHDWRNVLVANFSTGIVFESMQDCTYTSLRVRGCNTGIIIGPNVLCTQDVFVNPEVQTCTTCWLIQNASQFQFFGGLNQNYTTGFSLTPNIAGGLVGLQFFGTWMEAGTTAIKLDTTTGPIQNVEFNGTHMSGTSGTFSTAGANAIARLKLDGNDWNTAAVTIPSTSTGAVVTRNRLASFTDQGTGTFFLDSGVVGSNPISFTPNVGGNATYTAQSGRAIRVGKMVHINGSMTINVIGTGSAATISGLPFAASASPTASATIGISFFSGLTGNVIWIEGQVNPNASSMIFNGLTAAAANMLNAMSIMGNGTRIDFDGWYEAA